MKRSALIASRERPFHKRIRLACTFCRKRKVRCDGGEPCSFCRHLGTEPCVYAGAKSRIASASTSTSPERVDLAKSSPSKMKKRSSNKQIITTALSPESLPSCSSSPTSCSSASSTSSIDFDHIASTSRILPTVQIEQWQDLLSFSNLTAEFNASLHTQKGEADDVTLLPSFDYLGGTYLDENMWQPMSQGASISSSSFTTSPASSSAYTTSPLSTIHVLSPPWNNTHHWTNHYLDADTTYPLAETDLMAASADSMIPGDALGLCLAPNPTATNDTHLSYSAMAESDLFRRRALHYLSQISQ